MNIKKDQVHEGLDGVVAFESSISHIDGAVPELVIRGYDINDIVNNLTYEQMAYLLLYGDLPNTTQLSNFDEELKSFRNVPSLILDFLSNVPKTSHPMAVRQNTSYSFTLSPETHCLLYTSDAADE